MRKNTSHTSRKNLGFTLIELIIYVALIIIIISGLVLYSWNIIYSSVRSEVLVEVNQNLRLAGKRISYELRNATDVHYLTANEVCLESGEPAYDPVLIEQAGSVLRVGWGGGSTDCTGLTTTQSLTSNEINLDSLTFTDLSPASGDSTNIRFEITLSHRNPNNLREYEHTQTYQTSMEVRSL